MTQRNRDIRLATRGSPWALAQVREVVGLVERALPGIRIVPVVIETQGNRERDVPLHELAGYGHFTRAVDSAVLAGQADVALHSLKDLPVAPVEGLRLVAVPPRASTDDALVSRDGIALESLPDGAVIATSSLRRTAQICRLRPDLRIAPLRGNVDSRVSRLQRDEWDGMVLAEAGLARLGMRVPRVLMMDAFLYAAGQGALALHARTEDRDIGDIFASVHDSHTAMAVAAERAFLRALGAGCHASVGVRYVIRDQTAHLTGAVWSLDGQSEVRHVVNGTVEEPDCFGNELAKKILDDGGGSLLAPQITRSREAP